MPLVKLSKLLKDAEAGGYAIGYFESWDTYSFEAVLEAAEEANSPVVLGFGGTMMNQAWLERFGIEPLGAYGRVIAERAKVPVAFILNEVKQIEHVRKGVLSGYNTVMLDSCHLPFDENASVTRQVVELAKPLGIEVQAEFGRLPNFGEKAEGTLTDPKQARLFVEATQVDCLAVSIGNVHLQTEGSTIIDIDRLKAIRQLVDVPLVIHGGTGFPPDKIHEVIQIGVSLFHFGTSMKKAFYDKTSMVFGGINSGKPDYQALVGSRKESDVLMAAKIEINNIVKEMISLYGSSNKV
jgi:ketose-bisphosphate aldolase